MDFGTLYIKNGNELCRMGEISDEQLTADVDKKVYTEICRTLSDSRTTTFQASCPDFAHELDLLCRPYVIYYHPDDEDVFDVKEIKNKFIIKSTPAVDKGKYVIVDRRKFEDQLKDISKIKFDFVEEEEK